MTTPCKACAAYREAAGWVIALPLRLTAFVLIVAALTLIALAQWLDDLVTQSPPPRD